MKIRKRPPTHPGRILLSHYLEPLGMSQTTLANILGVSRKTVSKIINERGAVTSDMALRLSVAFDTTPELWLNLQQAFDLWQAATRSDEWRRVERVESAANAVAQ